MDEAAKAHRARTCHRAGGLPVCHRRRSQPERAIRSGNGDLWSIIHCDAAQRAHTIMPTKIELHAKEQHYICNGHARRGGHNIIFAMKSIRGASQQENFKARDKARPGNKLERQGAARKQVGETRRGPETNLKNKAAAGPRQLPETGHCEM